MVLRLFPLKLFRPATPVPLGPRKVAAFNTEIQDATVMVSRDAVPHCAIWSMNGTALRELGPILANAVWYPDEVATP